MRQLDILADVGMLAEKQAFYFHAKTPLRAVHSGAYPTWFLPGGRIPSFLPLMGRRTVGTVVLYPTMDDEEDNCFARSECSRKQTKWAKWS